MKSPGTVLALVVLGALLSACSDQEVKVYSVPKEAEPARPSVKSAAPGLGDHPVHWTTPKGWQELAPSGMRVGNLLVKKGDQRAEISIIPFPGEAGTEADNVNRWRGELGLAPIAAGEITRQAVPIGIASGEMYEMSGSATQTVAAILQKKDMTWFFKMRGDKALVDEQKPAFVQFLKSIYFHGDEETKPAGAQVTIQTENTPPTSEADKAPAPSPTEKASAVASADLPWDKPASWKETAPTAMVLKSYVAEQEGGSAKISITRFPGDVGGLLANVNRWRGQIGLAPVDQAGLGALTSNIDVLGGKATLVDMTNPDKKSRLMAAVVSRDGQSWFYKMMGDEPAVGREKDAFVEFVQTARYPSQ